MAAEAEDSETYFEAYHDVSVHELMIKDRPRMEAYAKAIERAQKDICGKVVVDVGCGTGILSLLCARAGAKKARRLTHPVRTSPCLLAARAQRPPRALPPGVRD